MEIPHNYGVPPSIFEIFNYTILLEMEYGFFGLKTLNSYHFY